MSTQNSKDIEENKIIAAIGYIFILCFIPLLLAKDSQFAQFHGRQALALFILEVITLIVDGFLLFIPIIGWAAIIIIKLLLGLLAIVGIYKALNGEMWEMPIVSDFAKKLNL